MIEWVSAFLTALVGASSKIDSKTIAQWDPLAKELYNYVQHNFFALTVTLPICWVAAKLGKELAKKSIKKERIQFLLNRIRDFVFFDRNSDQDGRDVARHHHRVTLFKYVRFRLFTREQWPFYASGKRPWRWRNEQWMWSGWLVPFARSYHTTQRSRTIFRAPNYADNVNGIAGQAWATMGFSSIEGLPDVSDNPKRTDVDFYAAFAGISPEWVMKKKPSARSLCGIPIKNGDEVWGVLLFDSRKPETIDRARTVAVDVLLGKYLTKLLTD